MLSFISLLSFILNYSVLPKPEMLCAPSAAFWALSSALITVKGLSYAEYSYITYQNKL